MANVVSKDGTRIAYDRTGKGPAIIIVNGAFGFRAFHGDEALSAILSKEFTVYVYDRRGRGESTDTKPYTVDREIEDIDALIQEAGGVAYLYGVSSGAALALLAASKLGAVKVPKLALYEPPYGSDSDKDKADFIAQRKHIGDLISKGKRGDAAAFFVTSLGTPADALEGLRKSPEWPPMESVEHTLAYDYAVLGDGAVPVETAKAINTPTLVMNGDKSFDFMAEAAKKLSEALPNGDWKTLKGQSHEVSPEAMAPALTAFFKS
jgi:pimeloyl-ACP methyl ester carboxylesterase